MWFHSLVDLLKPGRSRTSVRQARRDPARRRPATSRPALEALEDRCLLSTDLVYSALYSGITRTSTAGANGVAIDLQRNAYLTGGLADDASFAGGLFEAKFGPAGSPLSSNGFLVTVSNVFGRDIAVYDPNPAASGDEVVYVTGFAGTPGLATPNAYQGELKGPGSDAFVARYNAAGDLTYFTYLGGAGQEAGEGIAVDRAGNVYVTGTTTSNDFPLAHAYQPTHREDSDVFVTKLDLSQTDPTKQLVYSTYLGGNSRDDAFGIAVHDPDPGITGDESAYVTGRTFSTNFPTTPDAYQLVQARGDGFITRLDATGSALLYSTYFGGLGSDQPAAIAVDAGGALYVTGITLSGDFRTTPGAFDTTYNGGQDAFVAKLNPTGLPSQQLVYSTYLGGSLIETANGIAVDVHGNAYVTGNTNSSNFPTVEPLAPSGAHFGGGATDAFVAKLNATGSALLYSTYLGGSDRDEGNAIAVDAHGDAYVAGRTRSGDFPALPATPRSDVAFVAKISVPNQPPTITHTPDLTTNEDTPAGPINFTIGDLETAAGSLTLTAASSDPTLVPVANIVFGGSGAARTITLTPAPNLNGATTIIITVTDAGGLTTSGSFVLTVTAINDPPVFDAILPQLVDEDEPATSLTITGVSPGGGADEAGQTVTLSATSSDPAVVPNPSITGTGAARTLTYQPAANAHGTVTITVTADDGQAADNTFSRTFTITVNPVNDAPVAAADNYTADEGTPLTVVVPGVLDNDTDVEGDPLSAILVSGPAHGTLTLNSNGSFTYIPAAGFSGSDSFTYEAGDGATTSAPVAVAITVRPVAVVRSVQIDVRAGTLNLASNGFLTVSLLGTATFDAARIDARTVLFAGAAAVRSTLTDVDGDGDLDLVLMFRTQDTALLEIYGQLLADADQVVDGRLDSAVSTRQRALVALTGRTLDGEHFEGFDELDLFLAGNALRDELRRLAAAGRI